jgi:hypothetical protein
MFHANERYNSNLHAFKCPTIQPELLALHSTGLLGSTALIKKLPVTEMRQGKYEYQFCNKD